MTDSISTSVLQSRRDIIAYIQKNLGDNPSQILPEELNGVIRQAQENDLISEQVSQLLEHTLEAGKNNSQRTRMYTLKYSLFKNALRHNLSESQVAELVDNIRGQRDRVDNARSMLSYMDAGFSYDEADRLTAFTGKALRKVLTQEDMDNIVQQHQQAEFIEFVEMVSKLKTNIYRYSKSENDLYKAFTAFTENTKNWDPIQQKQFKDSLQNAEIESIWILQQYLQYTTQPDFAPFAYILAHTGASAGAYNPIFGHLDFKYRDMIAAIFQKHSAELIASSKADEQKTNALVQMSLLEVDRALGSHYNMLLTRNPFGTVIYYNTDKLTGRITDTYSQVVKDINLLVTRYPQTADYMLSSKFEEYAQSPHACEYIHTMALMAQEKVPVQSYAFCLSSVKSAIEYTTEYADRAPRQRDEDLSDCYSSAVIPDRLKRAFFYVVAKADGVEQRMLAKNLILHGMLDPAGKEQDNTNDNRLGVFLKRLVTADPNEPGKFTLNKTQVDDIDKARRACKLTRLYFDIAEHSHLSLKSTEMFLQNILDCPINSQEHYDAFSHLADNFYKAPEPYKQNYADMLWEIALKSKEMEPNTLNAAINEASRLIPFMNWDAQDQQKFKEITQKHNRAISLLGKTISGEFKDNHEVYRYAAKLEDEAISKKLTTGFQNTIRSMQVTKITKQWAQHRQEMMEEQPAFASEKLTPEIKKEIQEMSEETTTKAGADLPDVTPIRAGLALTEIAQNLEYMARNVHPDVQDELISIAAAYRNAETLIEKAETYDYQKMAQNIRQYMEEKANDPGFTRAQTMVLRSDSIPDAESYLKTYAVALNQYLLETGDLLTQNLQTDIKLTEASQRQHIDVGLAFDTKQAVDSKYQEMKKNTNIQMAETRTPSIMPETVTERIFDTWYTAVQDLSRQYYEAKAEAVMPFSSFLPEVVKQEHLKQRSAEEVMHQTLVEAMEAGDVFKERRSEIDCDQLNKLYDIYIKGNIQPALLDFLDEVKQTKMREVSLDTRSAGFEK